MAGRSASTRFLLASAGILALTITPLSAHAQSVDPAQLAALQQLIEAQQKQLAAQQKALNDLQRQMAKLQKSTETATAAAKEARTKAVASETVATEAKTTVTASTATADTIRAEAEKAADGSKTVTSDNQRVKVAISGQVNRMVNLVGDGEKTDLYFVDNNASSSRIRLLADGKINDDLDIGANIEVAVNPNNSTSVSQTNQDTGAQAVTMRKAEALFNLHDYGFVSLGLGDQATRSSPEQDLSGIDVVQYAQVRDLAGGILFTDKATGELTAINVGQVFNDFAGTRINRLRYDTPTWNGFGLTAAIGSNGNDDVALNWKGDLPGSIKGAASVGYAVDPGTGLTDRVMGSFSAIHTPTGLNLTASAGTQANEGVGTAQTYYLKAGWLTDIFNFGKTGFGIDGSYNQQILATDDEAWSVGAFAVQNITDYGVQLYAGLRDYSYNPGSGIEVNDVVVGNFGTRIKF